MKILTYEERRRLALAKQKRGIAKLLDDLYPRPIEDDSPGESIAEQHERALESYSPNTV